MFLYIQYFKRFKFMILVLTVKGDPNIRVLWDMALSYWSNSSGSFEVS